MNEVEVTWGRTVKVWWSLIWRTILFCSLAGFAVGFIIGFLGPVVGISRESAPLYSMLGGFVVGIPVAIWIVRTVLRTPFSDFRLALISTS